MMKIEAINNFFNQNRNVFIFLCIMALWIIFYGFSGRWVSGFGLPANHTTVLTYQQLEKENFKSVLIKNIKDDLKQRFRPFYIFQKAVKTKIFGLNSFWWVLLTNILTIFTTFFLFKFMQYLRYPIFESFLFLFFFLIGKQAEIWWVLPHNENIAMFLLSLSLYLMVLSIFAKANTFIYKIFFLFTTLIMSLTKESFLLLIPCLMFLYTWIYKKENQEKWVEALKKNYLIPVILGLTCCLEILYIKAKGVRGLAYAGLQLNLHKSLKAALTLFKEGNFFIIIVPLLALILLFLYFNKNKRAPFLNEFKIITLFFLIIVIPQIILHAKSGFLNRYLIPGLFGFSFLIAYLYNYIAVNFPKILKKTIAILIFFLFIFPMTINTWNHINLFTWEGFQRKALLNTILSKTTEEDFILIVADPSYNTLCHSFKIFLNIKYKRNNIFYKLIESMEYTQLQERKVKKNYRRLKSVLIDRVKNKDEIKAVIIFSGLEDRFLKTQSQWFKIDFFKRYDFKSAILYIIE